MPAVLRVIGQTGGSGVHKAYTSSQAALREILDLELNAIRESGTYKSERIITSSQGAAINVTGRQDAVLNFCANNYLGLSVGYKHSY